MADKTSVTKVESASLVTKEMADSFMEDGSNLAMQFERGDVAQSFLKIIQALSPEIDEGESSFVEGLKQGDLLNSGTGRFWSGKDGALVAPIHYQKGFTEWASREKSASLVMDYGSEMPSHIRNVDPVKGQWPLENGNTIIESAVYAVMLIDPLTGDHENAIMSLAGTQHKKARRWNRAIQNARAKHPTSGVSFQPAPFYYTYRLSTVKEENEQGKWYGLVVTADIELLRVPYGPELYQLCRDERKLIMGGQKKVQSAPANVAERVPGEEVDDIPF